MHLFRRNHASEKTPARPVVRERAPTGEQTRAFSYHANRSTSGTNVGREPTSAADERDRAGTPRRSAFSLFVHRLYVAVIVLALVAIMGNETMLSSTPKVVSLSSVLSQVFLRPLGTYQQAAAAFLQKSLANHNKLTINTESMSTALQQKFPELSAATVTLPFLGHQPVVYIQPSEPSMVLVTQTSGSFVLNTAGKALIPATGYAAQLAKLGIPTVVDQSGLHVGSGQTALPSTTVNLIRTVAAQLHAQGIRVSSMTLPPAAAELNVYISGEPFYVKFNTEDSAALQQVGAFTATYKHLESQGITPGQYIDVRLDGRAYYK